MTIPTLRSGARAAFTANAVLAWFGVLLVVVLSATDKFAYQTPDPHMFGHNPAGAAGAASRVLDTLSYFTEWSNIVVALDLAMLACAPHRETKLRRVLRLDALMMIVVTAIVYALLLAPLEHPSGWDAFTNPLQHIAVPLVTVLVWLIWGPRGRIHLREVAWALVIPAVWIGYTLLRGAVIHAYPYGFVDVITYGYPRVFLTIGAILIFGVLIGLLVWGIETLLAKRRG